MDFLDEHRWSGKIFTGEWTDSNGGHRPGRCHAPRRRPVDPAQHRGAQLADALSGRDPSEGAI